MPRGNVKFFPGLIAAMHIFPQKTKKQKQKRVYLSANFVIHNNKSTVARFLNLYTVFMWDCRQTKPTLKIGRSIFSDVIKHNSSDNFSHTYTKLCVAWHEISARDVCEPYQLTFINLEENIMETSPAVSMRLQRPGKVDL